jgi:hypothetical protein
MIDHPAQDTVMPGGRTAGAIRSGDTVVRPGGSWTPAVHAVLRHLEAVGFDGAPRGRVRHPAQGKQTGSGRLDAAQLTRPARRRAGSHNAPPPSRRGAGL